MEIWKYAEPSPTINPSRRQAAAITSARPGGEGPGASYPGLLPWRLNPTKQRKDLVLLTGANAQQLKMQLN